jgi:hypothetical protein
MEEGESAMNNLADVRGNLYALNNTFSGSDLVVSILLPGQKPITLGQASTLSYSIFRDKQPVKTLGRINIRGFTKATRTIAGTLIFAVFDQHVVNHLRDQMSFLYEAGRIKADELPPFDLILTGANEFGATASMRIYGVTVIEEGMTLSVEDIFTENIWSYQARDIRLLENAVSVESDIASAGFRDGTDIAQGFFKAQELDAFKDAQAFQAGVDTLTAINADILKKGKDRAKDVSDAIALAHSRAGRPGGAGAAGTKGPPPEQSRHDPANKPLPGDYNTATIWVVILDSKGNRIDGAEIESVTYSVLGSVFTQVMNQLEGTNDWHSPAIPKEFWPLNIKIKIEVIPKELQRYHAYESEAWIDLAKEVTVNRILKQTITMADNEAPQVYGAVVVAASGQPLNFTVNQGYKAAPIKIRVQEADNKLFPTNGVYLIWFYQDDGGTWYRNTADKVKAPTTFHYSHHNKSLIDNQTTRHIGFPVGSSPGTGDKTGDFLQKIITVSCCLFGLSDNGKFVNSTGQIIPQPSSPDGALHQLIFTITTTDS